LRLAARRSPLARSDPQEEVEVAAARRAPQDARMASIDTTGARIDYMSRGAGAAVLLIQGVGVVGEGWRPQVDGLADRFRLLTFDNRGIGASKLLAGGPLTIESMAADAWAVVDAAGVERVHVVGHSMGGVIAQEVALSAPARCKSLSFLCTFSRGREATRLSAGMLVTGLRTRLGTRAMRRAAFLSLVLPRAVLATTNGVALAEELAPLFGHDLADHPSIVIRQLRATARYDATARLATLASIPTMVVTGAQDRVARPAYGRALAAAIPGARYVEVAGAAHGVTIHSAKVVNDLLSTHFDAADGARRE
jgi:aminoacrylate hydrolase